MTKKNFTQKIEQNASRSDFVALGISVSAILMFAGTGSAVLPQIVRNWAGLGPQPDLLLVNALLLNIALIMFGWRRYKDLLIELDEHRLAEVCARQLAETDMLTDCLNRRSITPRTDALIEQANEADKHVAFIMLDLDNFKQINDCNGHQVGDLVLKTTAVRIKSLLPIGSLLARLGGDEFACVVTFDQSHRNRIDQLINRLIDAVSQPISTGDLEVEITISAGMSTTEAEPSPASGTRDANCLLHYADIAMYHAKKRGRNRYFWFEPGMEQQLRLRNELEAGIRKGLTNHEFVPYYEQQRYLSTGDLCGFEMLARWNSPELGIVKPDIFIPIAEEMGLIGDLSDQLFEQALTDAKLWDPNITLSVNISPIQLRDAWFAQKLLKLLVQHNFPPQRLEIEITETCLHENLGLVRSMMTSLRNQGVRISLDDFGTGYSSLSQLQSLPFDQLKIDRSFVSALDRSEDNSDSTIINAIISLGNGLSIPITAEGIGDNAALDRLTKMGALRGQGYYYGLPETAAEVKSRLERLGLYRSAPDALAEHPELEADIAQLLPNSSRNSG